jgi:hypothetical protein
MREELLAKVLEAAGWQEGGLEVFSSLRHGAAGVRWVEGRTRCTGDAVGAETADRRRGRGHAAAVLRGWSRWSSRATPGDRRGAASSQQPPCAHVTQHPRPAAGAKVTQPAVTADSMQRRMADGLVLLAT